jgi:TRAP-type C4-dicarboxylate transport system permease small subunit
MPMRALLQKLYYGCGVLAGICLIAICGFVIYSILPGLGLWYQGLSCTNGQGTFCIRNPFSYVASSADDFAGYAMLASSFLALAYTFGKGEHIRVTLVLQRLKGRARRIGEIWCLSAATLLSGFFAWYCVKLVLDSYTFGDKSTGLIPVPLWIPQIAMAVGMVVLFIAVLEQLIVTASGGPLPHDASTDEVMMER